MIATLKACLNKDAKIYKVLGKQPDWWKELLSINGVYAEIRKGDIVDIYYEGGRMAELRCKNGNLTAVCHPKYLGKDTPEGRNPKYADCMDILKNDPRFITKKIQEHYSQKKGKSGEDISEKKIQGDMICQKNPVFLDSEFAHRYEAGKQQTIRFDLVTISNDQLLFIELKRIGDNRMLNENDDKPEILAQMDKYAQFIRANKEKLLRYYEDLYAIKQSIGLPVPAYHKGHLTVCETPHLIVRDTYRKCSKKREERIRRIKHILDNAPFTYIIEK